MMDVKKSVSSRDVAREAGVSQATVSYILNNVENVKIKPETRAAVLDAVKKLNYHPNEIARGMKLKKSMSIGVVTDRNVTNFYFMKTLEGIRDGLQRHNYSITLLFNKPEEAADAEYVRYYDSNRLDGIIFAFADIDPDMADYLTGKGIPFVLVDYNHSNKDVYEVCTDYLSHIPKVIEYFISKGVKRIGYAGPNPARISDSRLEAFRRAILGCGLDVDEDLVVTSDFDDDRIFEAAAKLMTCEKRPEALLAGSPRFGIICVKCSQRFGIKVPEELKIIALGTSNFFTVTFPSLSAVELPLYDMGFKAAEMLIDLISGHKVEKSEVLPSELIIRDSG
ncbi:MAG: LacI family transcriptional regulator [Ruminiclostridium sp.]|nr:LacI family transcriptional regulator [Ruminiclostridium sp.]